MSDSHLICEDHSNLPSDSFEFVMKELMCGGLSGGIGVFVGIPFDLVKVRMQTCAHLYKSSLHCFQETVRHEGFAGLYKGMLAPILGQGAVNSLLFAGESIAMKILEPDHKPGQIGHPVNVFMAGSFGGLLQCLALVPSDVVKCNMQVDNVSTAKFGSPGGASGPQYNSMVDCTVKIFRREGIRGLYRGMLATCVREVPSLGIYFSVYKQTRDRLTAPGSSPSTATTLLAGGMAGAASWTCTYPFDVIKSNLQIGVPALDNKPAPTRMIDMAKYLYKHQGIASFTRGLGPTILRAFPVNAATFYFYEYFKTMMKI